jgi:hypothetical protein
MLNAPVPSITEIKQHWVQSALWSWMGDRYKWDGWYCCLLTGLALYYSVRPRSRACIACTYCHLTGQFEFLPLYWKWRPMHMVRWKAKLWRVRAISCTGCLQSAMAWVITYTSLAGHSITINKIKNICLQEAKGGIPQVPRDQRDWISKLELAAPNSLEFWECNNWNLEAILFSYFGVRSNIYGLVQYGLCLWCDGDWMQHDMLLALDDNKSHARVGITIHSMHRSSKAESHKSCCISILLLCGLNVKVIAFQGIGLLASFEQGQNTCIICTSTTLSWHNTSIGSKTRGVFGCIPINRAYSCLSRLCFEITGHLSWKRCRWTAFI